MNGNITRSECILGLKLLFEEERKILFFAQSLDNSTFQVQSDDLADPTDLTSRELETTMQMRLRSRESLYLKKIHEALRRIDQGTFGRCEDCDGEIDLRRLEVRPTTTFCVNCKEEQELQKHRYADNLRSQNFGPTLRLA